MIKGVVEKNGSYYRRFKIKVDGKWKDHYVKLPAPDDAGFAEALARANQKAPERAVHQKGTIGDLVVRFRAAMVAHKLADNTRRNRLYYLDLIEAEHGHRTLAGLRASHVYKIREALAETPGKANNYLAVLRLLCAYALERGEIPANPTSTVKPLKLGEHEPWPAEVQAAALREATPMLRLAIITGLCTGQRIGDVIRMRHNWHDGRFMQFQQQKTKVGVAIPLHSLWLEELARHERKAVTILYDRFGRPFQSTDRVQERMRRLMEDIGFPGYTFHGLRKNACCYLMELGLSDTEIGTVLGMTSSTVRHYGKKANVLMMATRAAEKLLANRMWETGFPGMGETKFNK